MTRILIAIILAVSIVYPVSAQETSTGAATTKREQLKQAAEARKEKIQERIETRKENIQNRVAAVKEKIATREAALKVKLQSFKNKRTVEITEKINTNLNRINQKQTEQMLKHLSRMSNLLDKLEVKVNDSNTKTATLDSRGKIASATAAVKLQADKDYTLQLTSESKVKPNIQSVRNQLHSDLQSVRKTVIEAKQSVANAISTARANKGTAGGQ